MSQPLSSSFTITVLDINRRQLTLLTSLSSEVAPGDILVLSDHHNNVAATTEVESISRFDRDTLTPSVNGNSQEIIVTLLSGSPRLNLTIATVSNTAMEAAKISEREENLLDLSLFDTETTTPLNIDTLNDFTIDQDDEIEAMTLGAKAIELQPETTEEKTETPVFNDDTVPEAKPEEFISKPVEENCSSETIAERLSRVSQEMFGSVEDVPLPDITEKQHQSAEGHFDSYIGDVEEVTPLLDNPTEALRVDLSQPHHEVGLPTEEQSATLSEQEALLTLDEDEEESEDEDFFDFDIDINLDQKLTDGPALNNTLLSDSPVLETPSSPETYTVSTDETPPSLELEETTLSQDAYEEPLYDTPVEEVTPVETRPPSERKPEPPKPEVPVDIVQPKQSNPAYAEAGYQSGDRIFTQEHGEGTVQKVFPFEDSYNLTVLFDGAGRKILNTKYSTIKKL